MILNKISNQIFTIDNFWTPQQCEDFIAKSEAMGYEIASINTEKGAKVVETVRNNDRVIFTDFDLANNIWQQLVPFVPAEIGHSQAIGLNEMFRFYKYQPGQRFKAHYDQSYIRNEVEASYYTFMIYLNDNYQGGNTKFTLNVVEPKQGMALVFNHGMLHEGSEVLEGTKYVLRTDIMYRLATVIE